MKIKNLFLIFIFGCAKVGTLNMQKHEYGVDPLRIVWIQVAGLSKNHMAMLKFSRNSAIEKVSFEKFSCMGEVWDYNNFKIRPSARDVFLGQMLGKKNLTSTCKDYDYRPVWDHLVDNKFQTGIIESGVNDENSLSHAVTCPSRGNYLENAVLWKMSKAPPKYPLFFHYQNRESEFDKGKIYYDRSCQKNNCFSSLQSNVQTIFQKFTDLKSNYLFIHRDFSYLNAIKSKNMSKAVEILFELEKNIQYFLDLQKEDSEMLVLVTSAAAHNLELPKKGKEWRSFFKRGRYIVHRKSALVSPVFASGARSENFCGMYESAEILLRMTVRPTSKKYEYFLINPFK